MPYLAEQKKTEKAQEIATYFVKNKWVRSKELQETVDQAKLHMALEDEKHSVFEIDTEKGIRLMNSHLSYTKLHFTVEDEKKFLSFRGKNLEVDFYNFRLDRMKEVLLHPNFQKVSKIIPNPKDELSAYIEWKKPYPNGELRTFHTFYKELVEEDAMILVDEHIVTRRIIGKVLKKWLVTRYRVLDKPADEYTSSLNNYLETWLERMNRELAVRKESFIAFHSLMTTFQEVSDKAALDYVETFTEEELECEFIQTLARSVKRFFDI